MSLFKQLLIAICVFLVVAFSGSFIVSLESSRAQYVNQLRSHAQDAATALALSLTTASKPPLSRSLISKGRFSKRAIFGLLLPKIFEAAKSPVLPVTTPTLVAFFKSSADLISLPLGTKITWVISK